MLEHVLPNFDESILFHNNRNKSATASIPRSRMDNDKIVSFFGSYQCLFKYTLPLVRPKASQ